MHSFLTVYCRFYLRVFELLLHIFDDRLTVQTDEGPRDEFWVNGMSAHNLSSDLQQCSDFGRCQLSNSAMNLKRAF